jgi:hypothetical protein
VLGPFWALVDWIGRLYTLQQVALWVATGAGSAVVIAVVGNVVDLLGLRPPWSYLFLVGLGGLILAAVLWLLPAGARSLLAWRARRGAARGVTLPAVTGGRTFATVGGDADGVVLARDATDGTATMVAVDGTARRVYVGDSIVASSSRQPRPYVPPREDLRADCEALARDLQAFNADRRASRPDPTFAGRDATEEERNQHWADQRAAESAHDKETTRLYDLDYSLRVTTIDAELRNAGIEDEDPRSFWEKPNAVTRESIPSHLLARCLLLPPPAASPGEPQSPRRTRRDRSDPPPLPGSAGTG